MVGTNFAGYKVVERLKSGGQADIYLATDAAGQQFALRLLHTSLRWRWTSRRRFWSGCEVASRLNHPNVVRCLKFGKERGQPYSVLEYVNGPNLKECILRNEETLSLQRLHLLVGMAEGLAHIHESGFMHLDFKPENVVVTANAAPKVIDFDLTRPRPDMPFRIRKLSGTPAYLAPEQFLRLPLDERVDIFAYGLTAYEMMTGRKPIVGETLAQVIRKYENFDAYFKPPRAIVPDIPIDIERVILKCLERDVTRRYPTMGLVVRDLQS
jgi:eukaryotic-like serine/threonine-protein kinase